jgi:hypothetical protein
MDNTTDNLGVGWDEQGCLACWLLVAYNGLQNHTLPKCGPSLAQAGGK